MDLDPEPTGLTCAECSDAITGTGYLPAIEHRETYEPLPDAAVCDTCGFNAVGMSGCAPELDDVSDADAADALLYVRVAEEGLDVISTKR